MSQNERNPFAISAHLRDRILLDMPCGLCAARQDEKLTLVFANESFYRMFGYTGATEAVADGFTGALDRLTGNACGTIKRKVMSLLSSKEGTVLLETQQKKRDGSVFWAMLHLSRVRNDDPVFVCAYMDISEQKKVEEELRFREEEYRIVAIQNNKLVFRYDIASGTAYLSQELAAVFQESVIEDAPSRLERAGIVGTCSLDAFHDLYATIRSGVVPSGHAVLQLKLGSATAAYEWYHITYSLIYREDQTPAQAVFSLQNVSEQHEREVAYKRWEQTYAAMSKDKTAYLEFDLTQNRLELQKGGLIDRFPPLNEQTMENVMRYFVDHWVFPEDRELFRNYTARDRLLASYFRGVTPEKIEYRHLRENGRYDWIRFSIQMLPDPYSANVRASLLLRDIDARKREELLLQDRLRTDSLTGVLNRSAFAAEADTVFTEGQPAAKHALVMLDVDHFKQINDCFGHGFGDRVLIRVAETLRSALRADDLIGRLGGDEFLVLLKNVPQQEVLQTRLNYLRELLFQRVSEDKIISCSFGAAVFPCDGAGYEELYQKTDVALYAAKNAGRNCVRVYNDSMNPPITLFSEERT